ncbi:amidohydrolase [Lederbergia wuyishanensis]|uniref:Amidohydrolase YtcJ n=1 Tax=Lederbergia wuyishanensis TaxID=1347903 RepID=A0ABU0D531_9BACI|nr:amidohydrolase [Lederbergia wuyishanensis]MCJ8009604.1 amidohydrolase [Lederbergia wuyishanensis]MDQ0343512.1 putative amidohydrolase YtcJ [Lederbergia wuyishanensis]
MKTIWYNGMIYTMEKEGETVEAVVTDDDLIIETGSLKSLRQKYDTERSIDLHGAMMIPGLVDSHMHLIGYGETFLKLNVSGMTSKLDVLHAIKEKVAKCSPGEWIIGEGWNENLWLDKTPLCKRDLDLVAPQNPVVMKRVCRHVIVVNSLVINTANINPMHPDPEGGVIERDKNGDFSGIFKDEAQNLIFSKMPSMTDEYVERALRLGIENCWKYGLTGAHTEDLSYYETYNRAITAFIRVLGDASVPFKAHLLVHHKIVDEWKKDGHEFMSSIGNIEFGAMKIFVDGSLGGRTALLSKPYADDSTTQGMAIHTLSELKNLVAKARKYKMPIATHVIGDLAFEYVLDAIEEFPPPNGERDRLIHAQILRQDLIDRAKKIPVVIDIQPGFTASDFPWVIDRVGKENMANNYAWKTLIDSGLHCSGGSDAPIESVNPLLGIHAAVTREKPYDHSHKIYMLEQRLSMFEAISLYTTGSAFACGHAHNRGMIKPGFTADFTAFNKDLFALENEDILKASVEMTVVDGKIVYQKTKARARQNLT